MRGTTSKKIWFKATHDLQRCNFDNPADNLPPKYLPRACTVEGNTIVLLHKYSYLSPIHKLAGTRVREAVNCAGGFVDSVFSRSTIECTCFLAATAFFHSRNTIFYPSCFHDVLLCVAQQKSGSHNNSQVGVATVR